MNMKELTSRNFADPMQAYWEVSLCWKQGIGKMTVGTALGKLRAARYGVPYQGLMYRKICSLTNDIVVNAYAPESVDAEECATDNAG